MIKLKKKLKRKKISQKIVWKWGVFIESDTLYNEVLWTLRSPVAQGHKVGPPPTPSPTRKKWGSTDEEDSHLLDLYFASRYLRISILTPPCKEWVHWVCWRRRRGGVEGIEVAPPLRWTWLRNFLIIYSKIIGYYPPLEFCVWCYGPRMYLSLKRITSYISIKTALTNCRHFIRNWSISVILNIK